MRGTENPKQPWVQAITIQGAKIVAVGDDATIEKMRGMGTKVINAGGKLVLPGFTDCHIHFPGEIIPLTQDESGFLHGFRFFAAGGCEV